MIRKLLSYSKEMCIRDSSTTMLMDSMKKTVKDSAKLNEADFEFKAIPVDLLNAEVENTDVLVVGPQIAHKIDYIKPIIDPYKIPSVSYTHLDVYKRQR